MRSSQERAVREITTTCIDFTRLGMTVLDLIWLHKCYYETLGKQSHSLVHHCSLLESRISSDLCSHNLLSLDKIRFSQLKRCARSHALVVGPGPLAISNK